jgi:glycosyltransferase involved in cell wall biosynthesis
MALEQGVYAGAAAICARSRQVGESLAADYGVPEEKIRVVGGGVNFPALPALAPRPAHAPLTILFIGKEFRRKGGDLLVEAFASLRADHPDLRLKLVTAGPVTPAPGVEVIAPTWDREAIGNLYRQADLFVLPSRLETWGDVLLEAMAFGVPCVGVSGQAMEEIIDPGVTGWLVEPENPAALADGIRRFVEDEAFRLGCGDAARARVEREFTWDRVARAVAGVIEEVLSTR